MIELVNTTPVTVPRAVYPVFGSGNKGRMCRKTQGWKRADNACKAR